MAPGGRVRSDELSDDEAARSDAHWTEPYLWAFAGGALIGLLYALFAQPEGEVAITDSWSYVPADEWWLHSILAGVTLSLAYLGIVLAWRSIGVLVRRGVLFTVVGSFLVAAALFFIGRATFGDETVGGRIAWVVMALLLGGVGVPMALVERRGARPTRRGRSTRRTL